MAATHVGPYTVEDYYALPEDGQRYELLDGALIVNAWPTISHQLVVFRLIEELGRSCPAEFMVLQIGVRIGDSVLMPDVTVTRTEVVERGGRDAGPADVLLVVEVVSPRNARMDRVLKPAVYAEAGIPSFWRIELDAPGGPELHAFELAGSVYREVSRVAAGTIFETARPFSVRFDPGALTRRSPG